MKRFAIAAVTILSSMVLIGSSALAQTTIQTTTKQASAKKTPKVWTDDNIESLRSPADVYEMQQEQEDEQGEAGTSSATKQTGAQSSAQQNTNAVPVVKTPQEADQVIARDTQKLKEHQDFIAQMEQQLPTAPASYQLRLKYRIKQRSAFVARLQSQIADLQKQKVALQAKAAAADGTPSSSSASIQN